MPSNHNRYETNTLSKKHGSKMVRFLNHFPCNGPEISDLIVSFDPKTLERQTVVKAEVIKHFTETNNKRAANIVSSIPANNGVLDSAFVDQLLLLSHYELQRLSEEFEHGYRVASVLKKILPIVRQQTERRKIRIVDIGCGTGYVIRWLAAKGNLGGDVELIGIDYNKALINAARELAEFENLKCTFAVANAFELDEPANLFISTGVLHHFRGNALNAFFSNHDIRQCQAFIHFDFQPSFLAPLGSWLFHVVRMRQPLSKHDGFLSAVRAHTAKTLESSVQSSLPTFYSTIFRRHLWGLPVPRVFHAVLGTRRALQKDIMNALNLK